MFSVSAVGDLEDSAPFPSVLISKEANLWADACTGGGLNWIDILLGQGQYRTIKRWLLTELFNRTIYDLLFEGDSFISQKLQGLAGDFRRFPFCMDSGCPRGTSFRWGRGGAFSTDETCISYYCWHGQHDLIIPFQGNKYKQCILIAGNMAKWLQRITVAMICQRAMTGENHPIGAGSGAGTLQPGETVSLHRPKSVPKDVFVCSLGAYILVLFESALGLSAR